jgi:Domain of unknown function (DUF5615)
LNLRFQADCDLKSAILKGVLRREPAIDFASAAQAEFEGVADPEVLERAARNGRVLMTHDRRTMLHHFRNYLAEGKSSPGLLVVSQGASIGLVVESIVLLWAVADPVDLRDRAYHLPSLIGHVFPR